VLRKRARQVARNRGELRKRERWKKAGGGGGAGREGETRTRLVQRRDERGVKGALAGRRTHIANGRAEERRVEARGGGGDKEGGRRGGAGTEAQALHQAAPCAGQRAAAASAAAATAAATAASAPIVNKTLCLRQAHPNCRAEVHWETLPGVPLQPRAWRIAPAQKVLRPLCGATGEAHGVCVAKPDGTTRWKQSNGTVGALQGGHFHLLACPIFKFTMMIIQ
jgi:hypothetical protein